MNAADYKYVEWSDPRTGLVYTRYLGVVHYYPDAPFYVDGVLYHPHRRGPAYVRTMIELFDDGDDTADGVMFASRPPTEAELDQFVTSGVIDGRRLS